MEENIKPLWIFGYGSLIWNPEFDYEHREIACLKGYARSFCMWSIHHRGTADAPGLVLALDETKGARCTGLAFRVSDRQASKTLDTLRARELISSAYVERILTLTLECGEKVNAVCYVIEKSHAQYCGGLPAGKQAKIIARAHGGRGPNTEYLYQTVRQLEALGICDKMLFTLAEDVRRLRA